MPNQHFDVQIISRSGGHRGGRSSVASSAYRSGTVVSALAAASMMLGSSAVASAAYRSGETLYDMQAEKTFDYRAKEDVLHTEIMTPTDAPVWASDRQMLWNQVEAVEKQKRKDAQLARDIIAALPRELNTEQQIALVREFVQTQFVAKGMIADIAIHDKQASDGGRQPHCHIMLTMRDVSKDGFGKKNRDWNKRTLVSDWRAAWEQTTNRHLAAAGRSERVSLRSYEDQGIDKLPGEHLGPHAWNMEKKGRETNKGDKNREITHTNEVKELVKKYDRREAPGVADPMLESIGQEQRRKDAPLLASVGMEAAAAQDAESDAVSGVLRSSDGDAELAGGSYTDEQLEAMHWASVRQAVRGLVRQSVHAIAEHVERIRSYSQQVIDRTQDLARAVIDRYIREEQRSGMAAPRTKDRELASYAKREAERQTTRNHREDLER
jgi:hypothetical protein